MVEDKEEFRENTYHCNVALEGPKIGNKHKVIGQNYEPRKIRGKFLNDSKLKGRIVTKKDT